MQPQFVTNPAFTVVGLLIHTKPMSPEIPQLWEQFVPRMDEVKYVAEPHVSYGLMAHDQTMTKLDYMAGNAVTEADELPGVPYPAITDPAAGHPWRRSINRHRGAPAD